MHNNYYWTLYDHLSELWKDQEEIEFNAIVSDKSIVIQSATATTNTFIITYDTRTISTT